METILLVLVIFVLGFTAGIVIGFKFLEADTKRLVREYQDYEINKDDYTDTHNVGGNSYLSGFPMPNDEEEII